ncbi:hypothetical protein FAGAP_11435 [Fusarium agapanthi]|uniref:C2H2-type domain-containing protein n=1 Tax=Fusarium agapanthi TaxID=1803897 RepID=A0A9P5E3E3_9HYPO|nr:hypothetical protein FAGAP_11435 [Fusarium agapanthi]
MSKHLATPSPNPKHVRFQTASEQIRSLRITSSGVTLRNVNLALSVCAIITVSNELSTDVRCGEVCVICFKLFEFASEIIRHCEENHRSKFGRKATYMKETLEEVSRRVSSELYAAKIAFKERTLVGSTSESKKRTRDEAGIDNEASETQGAELVALTTQRSQLHATGTVHNPNKPPILMQSQKT